MINDALSLSKSYSKQPTRKPENALHHPTDVKKQNTKSFHPSQHNLRRSCTITNANTAHYNCSEMCRSTDIHHPTHDARHCSFINKIGWESNQMQMEIYTVHDLSAELKLGLIHGEVSNVHVDMKKLLPFRFISQYWAKCKGFYNNFITNSHFDSPSVILISHRFSHRFWCTKKPGIKIWLRLGVIKYAEWDSNPRPLPC